jgi:hypothetical protein
MIGSMYGEKIMVISPLLKWYVEHGLKVTQIHQVVEYIPAASRNSEKTSEDRSDPESLRMERTEKDHTFI